MNHVKTINARSPLASRVMRRVYFIFVARLLSSRPAVKLYILVTLVARALADFSVQSVTENFSHTAGYGVPSLFSFAQGAFLNTEFAVQSALIGALLLVAWLVRDAFTISKARAIAVS